MDKYVSYRSLRIVISLEPRVSVMGLGWEETEVELLFLEMDRIMEGESFPERGRGMPGWRLV